MFGKKPSWACCRAVVPVLVGFGLLGMALPWACAQTATRPPVVWFDEIETPVALVAADADKLCRSLFEALSSGRLSADAGVSVPGANRPRAVFLSVARHGDKPAAVFLGVGRTLHEALADAVARASAAGMTGTAPRGVAIDIVQTVAIRDGFLPRQSPIPLPSLFGLAFGPQSGLAFLPDELTARAWVDTDLHLDVHAMSQPFVAREDWAGLGNWTRIVSFPGAQRVCHFETQSYYVDARAVAPLFRGHRLFEGFAAPELLDAARSCGEFLRRHCGETGAFRFPFGQWQTGPDEREPLRDHAAAMLALIELHRTTGDSHFLATAERAAHYLLTHMRPLGADGRDAGIVAHDTVALDVNSLAVLGLIALDTLHGDGRHRADIVKLGRHLLRQVQPGGDFVHERTYPADDIRATELPGAPAMATIALFRLYEYSGEPGFLAVASDAMDRLLDASVTGRPMELLEADAWLAEAMDVAFTFTRNAAIVKSVERLALAFEFRQAVAPTFPDFLGSIDEHPLAAHTAQAVTALARLARLLHDAGREIAATRILASIRLGLVFQMQAQIDAASALHLPQPDAMLGAFRDHVLNYQFRLHAQALQIRSLLAAATVATDLGRGTLPADERVERALTARRDSLARFPRHLHRILDGPPPATGSR